MATAETSQYSAAMSSPSPTPNSGLFNKDRSSRRRPFSTWVKKLTNFKTSSNDGSPSSTKRNSQYTKPFKKNHAPNNPYPESGFINGNWPGNDHRSFSTVPTGPSTSTSSIGNSRRSIQSSLEGIPPTIGHKSIAATISTEPDAARSDTAPSHGTSSGEGTVTTNGRGGGRGEDSTFSSPAPSVRSLTTTLTTIHSTTAGVGTNGQGTTHQTSHGSTQRNDAHSIHFVHQFPASPPPSAIPAHLNPQSGGHPSTYSTMTANNLYTDNASILTLASSSKRRRRRSFDTDASVRALAPSSLWGGSRESLPLSILSANVDASNSGPSSTAQQPRASATLANERASVYSATGVAPALPSERNSFYAGKQNILGDGGSVKSGQMSHGRNDSVNGSIGPSLTPISPLVPSREAATRSNHVSLETGEATEETSSEEPIINGNGKVSDKEDKDEV